MQLTIKTRDLDLTPALKEWIDEKIGSLDKFMTRFEEQGDVLCEVEVSRASKHHHKGDVFYAEAQIMLPGRRIRATHQDFDARVALDKVRDTLHREILKYKEAGNPAGRAVRRLARLGKETYRKVLWWRNKV
jgi:ribosomal subunit interface protein